MSRAFVKEPDGEAVGDDTPEIPVSPYPNRVTPRGLRLLTAERDELAERRRVLKADDDAVAAKPELFRVERRLRYVEKRIASAMVEHPHSDSPETVALATRVTAADEDDNEYTVTIVGEDEADLEAGRIAWTSPLARALLGKAVGDEAVWRRPKGDLPLEILTIEPDHHETG